MSKIYRIFLIGITAMALSCSSYLQAIIKSSQPAAAKNVILLISDGAGFNTFEAGNYYQFGERMPELYRDFPVKIASKTDMLNFVDRTTNDPIELDSSDLVCPECRFYSDCTCDYAKWYVKPQGYDPLKMWESFNYVREDDNYLAFTESAAAATAFYTGEKTTRGRMGMTWDEFPLPSIAKVADALGKSTGVVSSVQLSHATPGALWSHQKNRNMYADIAKEMIYYSGLDVIMGCGDPLDGREYKYVGGEKTWSDIIDQDGANGFAYIHKVDAFESLAKGEIEGGTPAKVIGVPHATETLSDNPGDVPSLETMAKGAIQVLSQNPNGFFLMIEGGAVDWKNHANNIDAMVKEQVDFNNTVAAVKNWVKEKSSWNETLVIIMSDHECGMLWGPKTYTDIDCGQADKCMAGYYDAGIDKFNGWQPIKNNGINQIPGVQYGSTRHTRALVPVFAKGFGAEMLLDLVDSVDSKAGSFWGFSGQYIDNTDIFTVMESVMNPSIDHSRAF